MLAELVKQHGLTIQAVIAMFRYAFPGNTTVGDFNDVLKQHGVVDVNGVRQSLLKNGYILKNCKMFLYDAFSTGRGNFKKYQIHKEDIPLLRKVSKNLDSELLTYYKKRYPSWELEQYDKYVAETLCSDHMKSHIGKFITKKKTFLINHYGVSRDSIESDLMMAAVYALYRAYPRYLSPLHFQNIAKTAIHNTGINLIMFHTRESRQRLMRDSAGLFQLKVLPLEFVKDLGVQDPDQDVTKSLDQIIARAPVRAREFLTIMRGSHHAEFSNHLGIPNEHAVEEMDYEDYKSKCCEFMRVQPEAADRFLERLRHHLA